MSWDYHIHSDYSDSDQTLKQILNQARQRNLEAIALTDHDCVEGTLQAAKLSPDLEIVLGVEVSAQCGRLNSCRGQDIRSRLRK